MALNLMGKSLVQKRNFTLVVPVVSCILASLFLISGVLASFQVDEPRAI